MIQAKHLNDLDYISKQILGKSICVIESDENFQNRLVKSAIARGFSCVFQQTGTKDPIEFLRKYSCDLIVIGEEPSPQSNTLLPAERISKIGCKAVLVMSVSADSPCDLLIRGAKAGAFDFFVRESKLDFGKEIFRIFKKLRHPIQSEHVQGLFDLAYMRSFNLTPSERDLIQRLSMGCARYRDLAHALGRTEETIRKQFSRIFNKMCIDDLGQLIQKLVICEFLRK